MDSPRIDERFLREWWISNSFGGWASSTVAGANTRKYHGLLCASNLEERNVLLSKFEDFAVVGGRSVSLSANFYPDAIYPKGFENIVDFSFDGSVARWTYGVLSRRISKEIWCARGANLTYIRYTLLSGAGVGIEAIPLVNGRNVNSIGLDKRIEGSMRTGERRVYFSHPFSWGIEADAGAFVENRDSYYNMSYPLERERDEEFVENLFSAGKFSAYLTEGKSVTFQCGQKSRESFDAEGQSGRMSLLVKKFEEKHSKLATGKLSSLVRAADSFIVNRDGEYGIIAGYPYFGEWGRDTMIALVGLLGCTGRNLIANKILYRWIGHLKDGLMPNRFNERGEPAYESADAALWFSWCVGELEEMGALNEKNMEKYFFALKEIASSYIGENEFVRVDLDGLLYLKKSRLTWMDAAVGGKAVTPRAGKRVEINALWCNLLFNLVEMGKKIGSDMQEYEEVYLRARKSMQKFYSKERGYLLDGIEPDDSSLRPNQLWALSLEPCGIFEGQGKSALEIIERNLWVAGFGLRSLDRLNEEYIGEYSGSMEKRDLAYHQGTIWPWMCGAYAQAVSRFAPQRASAVLEEFEGLLHSKKGALVNLCEVYNPADLEAAGCPCQAWSVGEAIRGYMALLGACEKHRALKLLEANE